MGEGGLGRVLRCKREKEKKKGDRMTINLINYNLFPGNFLFFSFFTYALKDFM